MAATDSSLDCALKHSSSSQFLNKEFTSVRKKESKRYAGELRTEVLSLLQQSLGGTSTALSSISLQFGFDFHYTVACFFTFIFPGPFFMLKHLLTLVEGHAHFQKIAFRTALGFPVIFLNIVLAWNFNHISVLPSEVIFPVSTYILVVAMHSLRYAFVEYRASRRPRKVVQDNPIDTNLVSTSPSGMASNSSAESLKSSSNSCLAPPLFTGTAPSLAAPLDAWWETEIDNPIEQSIAEEFMYNEQIVPPPSENPIGVRFDASFHGGSTTSLRHIAKWMYWSHLFALPFLVFTIFYRLFWLPRYIPFAMSKLSVNDISSTSSSYLSFWLSQHLLKHPNSEWILSRLISWDWILPAEIFSCDNLPHPSPIGVGSYRVCSNTIANVLGDHPIEFIFSLLTSLFVSLLFIIYFMECVEIFWMRLKMIRKFNLLTSEPLSSSSFDFYTCRGIRRWFAVRTKVLGYYETRFLSLQTSSVFLMIYSAGWAVYLIIQNSAGTLYLSDITLLAMMEIFMIWTFFFLTSQIANQINALQKEQVELLLRKKQAATASFSGRGDALKNSVIRESFDDVMNLLKTTEKPAKLFGLSIETKWVDTLAGIVSMSVGNILFHLLYKPNKH